MKGRNTWVYGLLLSAMAGAFPLSARPQQMSKFDRERALDMLDDVAQDVQKHYYDPKFHGLDWDAKVQEERQKIKNETSLNLSLAHIAAALDALNDSHTFFLPPSRPYRHDYGFQMQMIGDQCFVTRVRPDSDAEAKGVKPGDEILALEGIRPSRQIMWKMDYRYKILRPQAGLRLVLRSPVGEQRQVDAAAKIRETERVTDVTNMMNIQRMILEMEDDEHLNRARIEERGDPLMILKFPRFFFDQADVDGWMSDARRHNGLIVDLRGNPGGAVDTLKYVISDLFEGDVKIADRVGRKETKAEVARSNGRNVFSGKLIVLVDSKSASAAELFARLVQLEKRGKVMGDRSSGAVMEARDYDYHIGTDFMVFFGASITEWDLVMSDGKSLEHNGLMPDEVVLPTAADLANGRDPVLAHAAALLGVKITPEDAGKMFPYEWPNE
jgi:C-terminal processing protease CtpA/Prc